MRKIVVFIIILASVAVIAFASNEKENAATELPAKVSQDSSL